MRGLRKITKPKPHARRFEASRDDAATERTRAKPCAIRGRRTTVLRYVGVYPLVREEFDTYQHVCDGPTESHHVVTRATGGRDDETVPLCPAAHREFHQIGKVSFERRWNVKLYALTERGRGKPESAA